MSFLFFFKLCWSQIGAMGLATNISFADDAYPAMFLGMHLEGMSFIVLQSYGGFLK